MNKPTLLLFIIFFFIGISANAQNSYSRYLKKGEDSFKENKYLAALEFYDLAYEFAKTNNQKDKAREGKTKSKEKLRQQQEELLRALANAKKMQSKMELAVFDRAIKEEVPTWRGYHNYRNKKEREDLLSNVKKLDFYNASLVRLPTEVKYCKSLKEINLLSNYEFSDEEWKNCFETLHSLGNNYAQISINNIDIIDKSYRNSIVGLEIISKNLTEFPFGIIEMKKLKYLDISGNETNNNFISSLPKGFYQLNQLEKLEFNYCNIDSLSFEIENLKKIKYLSLAGNNLKTLPQNLQKLEQLDYLNISKNKLELGGIINLLPYFDNNIIISTDNKRENTNEEVLLVIVPDNQLNKSIAGLPINIMELDLADSKRTQLDSVLTSVESLKKKINITTRKDFKKKSEDLLITIPKLKKLPVEIVAIENLTYLDLSEIDSLDMTALLQLFDEYEKDIHISTKQNSEFNDRNAIWISIPKTSILPEEIGLIDNLVSLDLSGCKLNSITKEIGNLKKLVNLNLSKNNLSSLPKEIKKLHNLSNLNLSNNQLTQFPKELLRIKNLKQLDLSNNLIEEVPDEISKLHTLNNLNLANNRLKEIPETVNDLEQMQSIDLIGNEISNSRVIKSNIQVKTDQYELKADPTINASLKLSKGKLQKNSQVKYAWTDKHSGKREQTVAIILGFTAAPYQATINSITNTKFKSSIHFIIERDGNITQLVNSNNIAWHTGRSEFKDLKNFNNLSIGISLVNAGPLKESGDNYKSWYGNELTEDQIIEATHQNEKSPRYWQVYSQNQIETTYNLCRLLMSKYPGIKYILGHDEVSAGRKLDPGPAFPIKQLRVNLGLPLNKN